MGTFTTNSGMTVGYRDRGEGPVVLAIPGGPLRDADYLEEFGGLPDEGFRLVTLELPGTGRTPTPWDPAGWSAAAVADHVEELRQHLGLEQIALLAHSAGAGAAYVYSRQHPERVARMVLVTPSNRCLGLEDTDEEWERQRNKRAHEPWFHSAHEALEQMAQHGPTPELRAAMAPLLYARWDARSQGHSRVGQDDRTGVAHYWRGLPPRPELAAAMRHVTTPVRLLTGELDMAPGPELASRMCALFPDATFTQLSGCAHFPWIDEPEAFRVALLTALG
ncbi:alpha/beta fold hydrolase [Luteococcus sp. OSA5]|uniref:alpha/beta fold hydrolase n=1 Tax=Luteococcus sp. OSA5 TaxID=3401630 RepID=UPI003B434051